MTAVTDVHPDSMTDHLFLFSQWYQWQVSLVSQVSPALRDPPAHQVPLGRMAKVSPALKDLPDLPDSLVAQLLANLELQVDLANLVFLVSLVRREKLEPLASRALGDPLEPLEAQDPLVCPLLANLGLPVFLEQWDLEASQV